MPSADLLVIQDSINVSDNAFLRSSLNCFQKIFFSTPFGTDRSLLVELSQVPDIIAEGPSRQSGKVHRKGETYSHIISCTFRARAFSRSCQFALFSTFPRLCYVSIESLTRNPTGSDAHVGQSFGFAFILFPVYTTTLSVPFEVLHHCKVS